VAVGVNSATNQIYVANQQGNDVTVINGFTLRTMMVGVGEGPFAVVVNPNTNKIYVGNQIDGSVTVIDGATNHTTTLQISTGFLFAMAINTVTNKIYVVDFVNQDVVVIDGATLETSTVQVGVDPYAIAVNSATNEIYVANYCGTDPNCVSDGTVTVINGSTLHTSTVDAGMAPNAVAVNPVTNYIYVANLGDGTVTVINGSTNQTATVTVGNEPDAVAVNPVTNLIYVGNENDGTVTVINGSNNQTTSVSAGADPIAIGIDLATNKIYVVNNSAAKVTMIDGNTNNTTPISVGNRPSAVGIDALTNREYVTNTSDGTVSIIAGANAEALQFVPLTPCRLVDTRQNDGQPLQGNTTTSFVLPQEGSCGSTIPSNAAAYSLNVTVVPITTLGYLTIWPTGEDQPLVSTMNSTDGRVKANAAVLPAGYQGAVSVYVSDTTHLILDIDGYFAPPSSQTYEFYPVTPCRVVDTRQTTFPQGLGAPSLQAQQQRDLPILSSPCLQGITNPLAYSFNVTVVPNPTGQPLGYLTVWPSNQTQPVVSTLNNPTATVVANAAIVPAAPDGDIDVYAFNTTDLIIDIDGYFAGPTQTGLSMYPVAPCRVLDTRQNNGSPFMDELTVNVVGSVCAPPSAAQAYIFNATVVPPGSMPFLTLWPDGQDQPVVSTLNAYDGFITSNMAIVPTTNGSIDAWAQGLTYLILDISGYFAP
jgi:YVTN family beta-propeller protein